MEFFVVRSVRDYIQYAVMQDVTPPFAVYLSVISPGGKLLGENAPDMSSGRLMKVIAELEAGEILFPGAIISSASENIAETMRPTFVILWQTANKEGSPHYLSDGSWRLKLEQ
ncbi:hypothetical protein SD51_13650 [Alicyclobacillus tengchongensis]|nr:hypothetical protein SD51_13650 [Alicyclobacillus tengchongensis]